MIKNRLIILLALLFTISCSVEKPKLRIAVAANAQFAIQEIIKEFEKTHGIEAELIVGSSGNLTAQIRSGAPYDIFLSADMKYPLDVYNNGFAEVKPKVYAYGKLVLWSINDSIDPNPDNLQDKFIKHVAIANPKTAPYGKAAEQVLNYYRLDTAIKNKLVYGESVSQTNQFIHTGAVEVGFTSYSTKFALKDNNTANYYVIDQKAYDTIEQGVVILNTENGMSDQAKKFYNFLFTEKAKKIFVQYGYEVNYE